MSLDFLTTPLQNFTAALGLTDPPAAPGSWKNLTNGKFKDEIFAVVDPKGTSSNGVVSEEITSARRLQTIRRPGVDGATIRDFGADAETYQAEIVFFGPNYYRDFLKFKAICHQGTSGLLTLPDMVEAKNVYFERMSERSDHSGANLKTVQVTWVGTNEAISPAAAAKNEAALKAALESSVGESLDLLQSNPFISAIRAAETGISSARSLANAVFTLDQGIRSRIAQIAANIDGTLSLLRGASDLIHADTLLIQAALNGTSTGSGVSSPTGSPATVAAGQAAQPSEGTDPETGQRILDFTAPDTEPTPVDPLAKPALKSEVSINTDGIRSVTGNQVVAQKIIQALKSNRDELESKSGGRTSDLARSLTGTINAYQEFLKGSATNSVKMVQTPREMSLLEVMFYQGITPGRLRIIHAKNPDLDDPLVIPAGSVVVL